MRSTVLFFMALMAALSPTGFAANNLNDLVWQYRVLLIESTAPRQQIFDYLQRFEAEIEDRDIAWFIIEGEQISSSLSAGHWTAIKKDKQNLHCKQPVVLIGKDGGVKACEQVLEINTLFTLIDTMPMRQRERQKSAIAD